MLRAKRFHSVCVHDSQIICKSFIHYLYKMDHKNAICWTSIETENMLYFCFEFTIRCCEQNVLILYMHMTPKYSSNIWGTLCTKWTTQTQYVGLTLKPTMCVMFVFARTAWCCEQKALFCMCTWLLNNLQISDTLFGQNGQHKHNHQHWNQRHKTYR